VSQDIRNRHCGLLRIFKSESLCAEYTPTSWSVFSTLTTSRQGQAPWLLLHQCCLSYRRNSMQPLFSHVLTLALFLTGLPLMESTIVLRFSRSNALVHVVEYLEVPIATFSKNITQQENSTQSNYMAIGGHNLYLHSGNWDWRSYHTQRCREIGKCDVAV